MFLLRHRLYTSMKLLEIKAAFVVCKRRSNHSTNEAAITQKPKPPNNQQSFANSHWKKHEHLSLEAIYKPDEQGEHPPAYLEEPLELDQDVASFCPFNLA